MHYIVVELANVATFITPNPIEDRSLAELVLSHYLLVPNEQNCSWLIANAVNIVGAATDVFSHSLLRTLVVVSEPCSVKLS